MLQPETEVPGPQVPETELTPKRRRVLNFIRYHVAQTGYAPSLRQIQEAMGARSVSVAAYHVRMLAEQGFLRRDPRVARGLVIADPLVVA